MRLDASTNVDWISALSPSSGQGPADVSFSVSANEGSARDGMIEVNGAEARVSQRAVCRYEVSPSSQNVGSNGAVGRITVTTSAECVWRATTESEWIEFTSSTTGTGTGTVAFAVRLNDGAQRTASITIGGQRSLVTQASSPAPTPPTPSSYSSCSDAAAANSSTSARVHIFDFADQSERDCERDHWNGDGDSRWWLHMDGHWQRPMAGGHVWCFRNGERPSRVQRGCQYRRGAQRNDDDRRPDLHRQSGSLHLFDCARDRGRWAQ